MRLFNDSSFIEASRKPVVCLGESGDAFGPSYGNRIANERALRMPWKPGLERLSCQAEVDVCAPAGSG